MVFRQEPGRISLSRGAAHEALWATSMQPGSDETSWDREIPISKDENCQTQWWMLLSLWYEMCTPWSTAAIRGKTTSVPFFDDLVHWVSRADPRWIKFQQKTTSGPVPLWPQNSGSQCHEALAARVHNGLLSAVSSSTSWYEDWFETFQLRNFHLDLM